jgi:hypothetical protein
MLLCPAFRLISNSFRTKSINHVVEPMLYHPQLSVCPAVTGVIGRALFFSFLDAVPPILWDSEVSGVTPREETRLD